MLIVVTGALAGFFHVLAGPDHLAAVAPLAVDGRRRGWVAGWTWGVGHASGVVVVALLAVLLRDVLPPIEAISAGANGSSGAALIVVGFWALRRSMRSRPAPHVHGPVQHDHLHVQAGPGWIRRLGHAHASFCLGVLHGVAGSSHFFGVIPALALPTRAAAVTYIAAFGAGTVARHDRFCRDRQPRRRPDPPSPLRTPVPPDRCRPAGHRRRRYLAVASGRPGRTSVIGATVSVRAVGRATAAGPKAGQRSRETRRKFHRMARWASGFGGNTLCVPNDAPA